MASEYTDNKQLFIATSTLSISLTAGEGENHRATGQALAATLEYQQFIL